MSDDIESRFQGAIDAGKINGAVICATDSDGRFVYNAALGERTLLSGEKEPQRLDDVLYLASATKLIATIAALQCVDDGLLSLTGDLSQIAPEIAAKQVITGFSNDGETPLLEPPDRPITLEMLLSHSSGISYDFMNPHVGRWRQKFDPPPVGEVKRRGVEEAFSYPLGFQPGTSWMYGPGLDWAGRLVERVTGRTLGEHVQQRICDPLGITDAQFYPVTREDLRSRLVDLNPQDPECLGRAVLGGGGDMNKRSQGAFGGHGLFMPGSDYIKVLRSLLANDGKLLEPATVDNMFQNHLTPEATIGHRAALAGPIGVFFRVGIDPGTKVGHGLGGVLTLQDADGWYGERTLTWGGGLTLTWFIDRKNNLCGVGAVQATLPLDNDVVAGLKQTFRRDIYRKYAAWKDIRFVYCGAAPLVDEVIQVTKNLYPDWAIAQAYDNRAKGRMLYFCIQQALAISVIVISILESIHAASWKDYRPQTRIASSCPDYIDYAQKSHQPLSSGKLKLPFMRPNEKCRTFKSPAVERIINDVKNRARDPDLARLFENAFPSTLDTTVKYFDPSKNLAFIVTGDITAQWLRDTGNQFAHLYKLLPKDKNLKALVKGVINTEARYISEYPYCGAFQPPPESGLKPSINDYAELVTINPPVDNQTVFECKFELDSLAGFLKIVRSYYTNTGDSSFINYNFKAAMAQILRVIDEQSQSTWADDWTYVSYYNWTGEAGSLSPPVPNSGNGEPKLANGLVACSHRPSDDLSVFNYVTSDNAMMSVELDNVADVLDKVGHQKSLSRTLRRHAHTIRQAVWDHTLTVNGIFAYETNGYGGQYIMDDANVPSLVSLPYLGFIERDSPTYKKTKAAMFSRANPYYAVGRTFRGIGGPHANATNPWPMAHISAIFGTDNDEEIKERLNLILENTSGLGLIHESVNIYNSSVFTRPWFAWANSYFAEMVLDLAERKPGLIFKDNKPYVISN
ncbi:Fc.00g073630.m01.CDS01 [Cosmosporella sp. VM-42]